MNPGQPEHRMTPSLDGKAGILLRAAGAADEPFFRDVFCEARADEFAAAGLAAETLRVLLHQQFRSQCASFSGRYPLAQHLVIERNGQPIGRLVIHRTGSELSILEIGLLAAWRNRGIGAQVLAGLIAEADSSGSWTSLHVEARNPARKLYERLGFQAAASSDVHIRMTRAPREQVLSTSAHHSAPAS